MSVLRALVALLGLALLLAGAALMLTGGHAAGIYLLFLGAVVAHRPDGSVPTSASSLRTRAKVSLFSTTPLPVSVTTWARTAVCRINPAIRMHQRSQ
jgi:hypothetical protein